MKMYYSLFKMKFMRGLQYRASALAGIGTQFFFGAMYIMIFKAFYDSSPGVHPITFQEQAQVIWLRQAFLFLFMMWFRDTGIINSIMNGDVAYELCRPSHLYWLWFAKIQAQRLSSALLRCGPLLIIALLLPHPYRLIIPKSIITVGLFLMTSILGIILSTGLLMLIYVSMFYTLSPTGSYLLIGLIDEFFSGAIIPVPLMPDILRKITYILPFRYTFDLPFRIFAGNIHCKEAIISMGIQLTWISIIISFGYRWMRKTMNKVTIQGG